MCEGRNEIEKDYVLRKMSGVDWTGDITYMVITDDAMRYLLIMACVRCQIENLCYFSISRKKDEFSFRYFSQ